MGQTKTVKCCGCIASSCDTDLKYPFRQVEYEKVHKG